MRDIVPQIRDLAKQLRASSASHMHARSALKLTFNSDVLQREALRLLADRCRRTAEQLEEILNERQCSTPEWCGTGVDSGLCDNCVLNLHFAQCATEKSGDRGMCAVCDHYVMQCRCDVFTPYV